jgi:Domain of unknown function (DUF1905)
MALELTFTNELIYWRGPAPFYFVPVPAAESALIKANAAAVSYGWGVIPAQCRSGDAEWSTSLFPKNGGYLVPVKKSVWSLLKMELGEPVEIELTIDV